MFSHKTSDSVCHLIYGIFHHISVCLSKHPDWYKSDKLCSFLDCRLQEKRGRLEEYQHSSLAGDDDYILQTWFSCIARYKRIKSSELPPVLTFQMFPALLSLSGGVTPECAEHFCYSEGQEWCFLWYLLTKFRISAHCALTVLYLLRDLINGSAAGKIIVNNGSLRFSDWWDLSLKLNYFP